MSRRTTYWQEYCFLEATLSTPVILFLLWLQAEEAGRAADLSASVRTLRSEFRAIWSESPGGSTEGERPADPTGADAGELTAAGAHDAHTGLAREITALLSDVRAARLAWGAAAAEGQGNTDPAAAEAGGGKTEGNNVPAPGEENADVARLSAELARARAEVSELLQRVREVEEREADFRAEVCFESRTELLLGMYSFKYTVRHFGDMQDGICLKIPEEHRGQLNYGVVWVCI